MTFIEAFLSPAPLVDTAYYVRELTPGWPPGMHRPQPGLEGPQMIQVPIERLQEIGMLLGLAILCLVALTLAIGRKAKARKRS